MKTNASKDVEFYEKKEFIDEAEACGIDLNIDFKYNGRKVLNMVNFNNNNINTYGTGLLGKLFTKDELASSTFESTSKGRSRVRYPLLSPTRRNLVKACYFVKLEGEENYSRLFPNVIKALNQKCNDSRKPAKSDDIDTDYNNNAISVNTYHETYCDLNENDNSIILENNDDGLENVISYHNFEENYVEDQNYHNDDYEIITSHQTNLDTCTIVDDTDLDDIDDSSKNQIFNFANKLRINDSPNY